MRRKKQALSIFLTFSSIFLLFVGQSSVRRPNHSRVARTRKKPKTSFFPSLSLSLSPLFFSSPDPLSSPFFLSAIVHSMRVFLTTRIARSFFLCLLACLLAFPFFFILASSFPLLF